MKESADRHDRFCKQLNISPTELTEILDTFVARKGPVYKAKIPAGVSWRVQEEYFMGIHDKRTVDVMLDGRVSKDVLGEIAKEIKSLEQRDYEITDVRFFIPDQDKKLGCWAESRDSPDRKFLSIVGFTAEEAEHLLKLPLDLPDGSEFIGCWLREEHPANERYAFYGLNGRHYFVHWYANDADGSHRQTEEMRSTLRPRVAVSSSRTACTPTRSSLMANFASTMKRESFVGRGGRSVRRCTRLVSERIHAERPKED